MSDDARNVDPNRYDASDESRGFAPGEEPRQLDAADTDAARVNYATFAIALAESAEAQREAEATGDTGADADSRDEGTDGYAEHVDMAADPGTEVEHIDTTADEPDIPVDPIATVTDEPDTHADTNAPDDFGTHAEHIDTAADEPDIPVDPIDTAAADEPDTDTYVEHVDTATDDLGTHADHIDTATADPDTPADHVGARAYTDTYADNAEDDEFLDSYDDTVYSGLEDATEVVDVPGAGHDFADDEAAPEDLVATAEPKRNWRRDIWRRQINVKPSSVILVLLLLISGGVTAWLYLNSYRPDEQTNQHVAREALHAASEGTVALLSYSPDSLDKDFAAARSHLTGDFLSYYDQFTQQIVAPAAKQKSLKTTAQVKRAAVQELRPTSAVVLIFVDQNTTSKDNPEPSMAPSSVLVNLALIDGKWLITKFTPV